MTAESCAPGNSALDPGETVTRNLPIVNDGGAGATTTNLVATLQATGGVSSPSGPQNYGSGSARWTSSGSSIHIHSERHLR